MSRPWLAAVPATALVVAGLGAARPALDSAAERSWQRQYEPKKVTICHRTNSKAKPFVTVTVAREALPTYLRRGDTVGACVYGSVRAGGRVSLRTSAGAPVTALSARRLYSIVVSDLSRAENFHLLGERVDRRTGIVFRGTVRWKITFARGRYSYFSDAHPATRGSFTAR